MQNKKRGRPKQKEFTKKLKDVNIAYLKNKLDFVLRKGVQDIKLFKKKWQFSQATIKNINELQNWCRNIHLKDYQREIEQDAIQQNKDGTESIVKIKCNYFYPAKMSELEHITLSLPLKKEKNKKQKYQDVTLYVQKQMIREAIFILNEFGVGSYCKELFLELLLLQDVKKINLQNRALLTSVFLEIPMDKKHRPDFFYIKVYAGTTLEDIAANYRMIEKMQTLLTDFEGRKDDPNRKKRKRKSSEKIQKRNRHIKQLWDQGKPKTVIQKIIKIDYGKKLKKDTIRRIIERQK